MKLQDACRDKRIDAAGQASAEDVRLFRPADDKEDAFRVQDVTHPHGIRMARDILLLFKKAFVCFYRTLGQGHHVGSPVKTFVRFIERNMAIVANPQKL